MVHFQGTDYRSHTSCISEAQKYQGALYREKKGKQGLHKSRSKEVMRHPPGAYVEDVTDLGEEQSQAIAVIDVPPRAPTPPPAAEALPQGVNVFDFLVTDETPNGQAALGAVDERQMLEDHHRYADGHDSQYSQYSNGHGDQYLNHGFTYGDAPVNPAFERYNSMHSMIESQQSGMMPPPFATPGPKKDRNREGKSDKKRKRQQIDELDLSASKRPSSRGNEMVTDAPSSGQRMLHSGLTGGLSKLVTDNSFYDDRIDAGPTPISPVKRSKRERDRRDSTKDQKRKSSHGTAITISTAASKPHSDSSSTRHREPREYHDDRHRRRRSLSSEGSPDRSVSRASKSKQSSKAIVEFAPRPQSVQPTASNQVGAHYSSKAELFMSFVNKGPDSERGLSINKALKRFHREVGVRGDDEKEEEDKELWKNLRVRRNDRGEIVLFV